jgi:hypothetical protein
MAGWNRILLWTNHMLGFIPSFMVTVMITVMVDRWRCSKQLYFRRSYPLTKAMTPILL